MTTGQDVQNDPTLNSIWQSYAPTIWDGGKGMNADNWNSFGTKANALMSNFSNSFETMVGRKPTQDETNQFVSNYIAPNANDVFNGQRAADPYTYINQFVGQNYQGAAKDYATQQLTAQQGQANSLADMFRTQGTQAINDTEQSLLDYQSKLFEKLRPSLLTSLQSQGLLDTGGLNSAIAGSQADLANSVQPFLANARLSNDQQANAISQAGAAAPYQYQQSQIMNQVPYMQGQGQQAMQQGYNTFLTNLNYSNQLGLQNNAARLQDQAQPGLLGRLGQSFTTGFGNSAGNSAGQWMSPNPGGGGQGGGSGMSGPATMMALFSHRKFKKDITALTEKEEDALYDRIVAMPLNRWRYKSESSDTPRHLGTMTDEAIPEIVMEDGERLSVVDYLGALTLAIKVQHRRMLKGQSNG